MTVHELQQEILRLKREKISASWPMPTRASCAEVADYTGDSYGLEAVQGGPKTNADGVIMCMVCDSWPKPAKFKPGENRLAGQPHVGLPYGRAA